MTNEELEKLLLPQLRDAIDFCDSVISPERVKALKYYQGQPFGDERQGRSQYISREVRDTVQSQIPSLVEVFLGTENVVEYVPRRADAIEMAEQATEAVQYIISEENDGFSLFFEACKDALTLKTGILKAWVEEKEEIKTKTYNDVPLEQAAMLVSDPDVADYQVERAEGENVNLTISYKRNIICYKVASVPPEEFLVSSNATSLLDAGIVAHRTLKTKDELLAMGISEEAIEECGGESSELDGNEERLQRQPFLKQEIKGQPTKYPYFEAIAMVDSEGIGPELRKFCFLGDKIVNREPCGYLPFSVFCPDPEPHTVFGSSTADAVMDLQRLKSQIIRSTLDSLAQSVNPKTGVMMPGILDIADVMNDENGAIIRMLQHGSVEIFTTPFVGRDALPMIDWVDSVREGRTGITKASQGLNADALQSSTASAVNATVTMAQQRIKLIARIFAETGWKQLFKILLRLITDHPDKARMMRLRGKWVEVDASKWDPMMDVRVNIALGASTQAEKIGNLNMILAKQEQILANVGIDSGIVTAAQYATTLQELARASGYKDPSKYFSIPDEATQQKLLEKQQQQGGDQGAMLQQMQAQQIQADIAKKKAELELKARTAQTNDDLQRDKLDQDALLKIADMEMKHGISMEKTKAQIEQAKAAPRQ